MNKHDAIISAALSLFGHNGYKKTSMNDIATLSGVSKASLFYYFGTKLKLYEHLVTLCFDSLREEIEKSLKTDSNDFFERIKTASNAKREILQRYPHMLAFIVSAITETEAEAAAITAKLRNYAQYSPEVLLLKDSDLSKFKDGVNVKLIIKILTYVSERFAHALPPDTPPNTVDHFLDDVFEFLDMLKKFMYK